MFSMISNINNIKSNLLGNNTKEQNLKFKNVPQSKPVASNNSDNNKKTNQGAKYLLVSIGTTAIAGFYMIRNKKWNKIVKLPNQELKPTEEAQNIYQKIKSIINNKNKLSSETIDKNLKPREKQNTWNYADMYDYYSNLEKESYKKIEAELIQKQEVKKLNLKHSKTLKLKQDKEETERINNLIDNAIFDDKNEAQDQDIKTILKSITSSFVQLPKNKTIEELTLAEKNNLLDCITASGYAGKLLKEKNIFESKLLPTSEKEYISLIDKLVDDITKEMKPLDKNHVDKFRSKLNNFIKSDLTNISQEKLTDIEKTLSEIFTDGRKLNIDTIISLRKIYSNPQFNKLSEKDKQLITIAGLLHNTSESNLKDIAFDSYIFAQKYGFSTNESEKLANIIKHSDLTERFMSTNNKIISINRRKSTIYSTDRVFEFFSAAKDLREGNSYEMAQMLYSTKEKEGLTRFLDKKLKNIINELNACEEIIPQTDKETILKYAHEEIINGRKIMVANANDIPNFYAYVHTHNIGFANYGLRNTKLMKLKNFKAFQLPLNDKVICASLVGRNHYTTAGTSLNDKNGLILKGKLGKIFVNSEKDIFSLSKSESDMIYEFGYIPSKLKEISPNNMSSFIANATCYIPSLLQINKAEYLKRIIDLKTKANGKTISYDFIKENDPKILKATNYALEYILDRNNSYSESLLSNPELTGIFQLKGSYINDELLDFAVENKLPLVIFTPKYWR